MLRLPEERTVEEALQRLEIDPKSVKKSSIYLRRLVGQLFTKLMEYSIELPQPLQPQGYMADSNKAWEYKNYLSYVLTRWGNLLLEAYTKTQKYVGELFPQFESENTDRGIQRLDRTVARESRKQGRLMARFTRHELLGRFAPIGMLRARSASGVRHRRDTNISPNYS